MAESHDVVVLGVGGMGSAVTYELAKRGLSVVGIERNSIGHDRGSSHGLSRIIRLAYFEHPSYVPLLKRAFALWRELEAESGQALLHVTGAIDAGVPGSRVFEGSLEACGVHGLTHEVLNPEQVHRRFQGYHLPDDCMAVYQPDGGFSNRKSVFTRSQNERSHAAREFWRIVVLVGGRGAAPVSPSSWRTKRSMRGSWCFALARGCQRWPRRSSHLLRPERQVVAWFEVEDTAAFRVDRFPVFVMTTTNGTFYGFPEFGVPGFKIGKYHHRSETVDPDSMDRTVHASDEAVLRECVQSIFPGANGPVLRSSTCIFTNTPDEHFIIDRLPDAPEVLVVSACSGHGFKFCSVVGEIVADLLTDGHSNHDLSLFRLDRFGKTGRRVNG